MRVPILVSPLPWLFMSVVAHAVYGLWNTSDDDLKLCDWLLLFDSIVHCLFV